MRNQCCSAPGRDDGSSSNIISVCECVGPPQLTLYIYIYIYICFDLMMMKPLLPTGLKIIIIILQSIRNSFFSYSCLWVVKQPLSRITCLVVSCPGLLHLFIIKHTYSRNFYKINQTKLKSNSRSDTHLSF